MRMRQLLFAAATALAVAGAAEARLSTGVQTMSIAEGESFEFSPFAFEVRFADPVEIVHARLVDQEGRVTPVDLSFNRGRTRDFVIELPVLEPHGYRLTWRVRTERGVEQQGSVGFLVKGCDDPRGVPMRSAAR